jgi:uncharacterized membrane protein YfcA
VEFVFPASVLIAAFLAAGFVKGVLGMGLPTVAMGLLGVVFAPVQAAALLLAPNFVLNVWQATMGPSLAAIARRLWLLGVGVCAGIWLGADVLTSPNARIAAVCLGVVLALYGCLGFVRATLRVPARHEPWLSPLVGLVTGAITGATGVFVIPAVPYIQALGLEKEELIQALALAFLVSCVALGGALVARGAVSLPLAGGSLAALAPAMAGMLLGQKLRVRISAATFRRAFFSGMIVLGAYLALRNLVTAAS